MEQIILRLCFLSLLLLVSTAPAAERPNILFIFADDLTYQGVHALGNDEIQTPHLDGLVRDGLTFTHCYNQGAWGGAVCVASRTMLVTGRYLWHAHRDYPQTDQLYRQQNRLWPQLFEQAGYDTYFTGKWHIQADATKAFTVARHVRPGMPRDTKQAYNRPLEGEPDVWKPWDKSQGGFWEGGRHWSEIVADDGVEYIQQAAKSDKPFFMYLAFNAPHDPRQSPRDFVDRYSPKSLRVPKNFLSDYPYDIGSNRIRDEKLAPFPRTPHAVQVHRQEYYAITTHMDEHIGRILQALRDSGKQENTYVVFTADHGLAVGHHGLLGKQNMFDHSMRVPFMIVGPNISAGDRNDTAIYLQDIVPTTLKLAGIEVPQHIQFRSLLPLARRETQSHYDSIYGGYTNTQRMIVKDDHKLVLYPQIKKALLFDLQADPDEMHDLAERPDSKDRIGDMFTAFQQWQRQVGDDLEVDLASF